MIEGRTVPRLILATVSDGQYHAVLRPDQLAEWVVAHLSGTEWVVTWNAKFDFAVVRQYLQGWADKKDWLVSNHNDALKVWDALPGAGRLRDGMLLDFLVRLADPAVPPGVLHTRSLDEAARQLCGIALNKDDEIRLTFGNLPHPDEWTARTDLRPWFDYAVEDTAATYHVYDRLTHLANVVGRAYPEADKARLRATWRAHGPLTETLQVRADIALDEAGRRGMALDSSRLGEVQVRLSHKVREEVDWLDKNCPAVFARDQVKKRLGQLIIHKKTGVPQMSTKGLLGLLQTVAQESEVDPDDVPLTPKGAHWTTSAEWWREAAGDHPFVAHWAGLLDTAKLLQFVAQLEGRQAVQSDYHVLVRTGRTSCRKPNIQQMPKAGGFRELFVARPGHKFVIADYAAVELVTLAAVLESLYPGRSTLATVLREGRKPHDYTAALIMGVPYEDFLALKKTDPDFHKARRQAAKAINFGVPGGLGAKRLALYAKANYGVELSEDEAGRLRSKLITEVYPELEWYLEDDPAPRLAKALWTDPERVRAVLTQPLRSRGDPCPWMYRVAEKVTGGVAVKADGTDYAESVVDAVWGRLEALCPFRCPLYSPIKTRRTGYRLRKALFGSTVTTLTGRVRGGAEYTEARNTPFQGLAADGAKAALWQLRWYAAYGWHTVAFVHDEIVVEVPEAEADKALHVVPDVMKAAMRSVLGTDLPVEVEAVLSDSWVK